MDEVQLSDSAYQNRNIFISPDGKIKFQTISFNKKDYLKRRFCDLELSQPDWQEKHYNTLISYYGKHKYFKEILPNIEPVFKKTYSYLIEPVMDSMRICMEILNIPTKINFQHMLDYSRDNKKSDLVLSLVKAIGADIYLAGNGSKDYMQLDSFEKSQIRVIFNNFKHPQYEQKNTVKFEAGLSSLDLFFNMGIERSREIFWQSAESSKKDLLQNFINEH
jgi:hypothetical protein